MKKRLIVYFMLIACCFIGVGCGKSYREICLLQISETRENYFFGQAQSFVANFTSGRREKEFVYDGKSTELIDYGVIVVDFNGADFGMELPQFELAINGEIIYGELEYNPFNNTYCFDICRKVEEDDVVELYIIDIDERIVLDNLSGQWKVDFNDAFKIAIDCLKDNLKVAIVDGVFQGEIYQKLLSTSMRDKDSVYWQICVLMQNGEIYTCTIDTKSGDVVAV